LDWQLKQLCFAHKEGSYATQHDRQAMLELIGKELREAGYKKMTPSSLKPKHVEFLVKTWKGNELSPGTIKNRLSAVRWWAAKVGKPAIIPRTNKELGVDERGRVATESKGKALSDVMLKKVSNEYVSASLRLQEAFGLRKEESIKIFPNASKRGVLCITKSKGGRARTLEIRTNKQKAALDNAQRVAGGGALIPPSLNYVEQLNIFKGVTSAAGICNVHGFRHFYAQERYKSIMGSEASINGGAKRSEMSPNDKTLSDAARMLISQELGHGRIDVIAAYLGS
jgi:hypothetical protein